MEILGLTKMTLLDYPEHIGATIFTPGCNMRCAFCHNKDLVIPTDANHLMSEKAVLDIINKRKNVLEGICITGGEPTLQKDLYDFIRAIKALGLKVKLDTNGLNPKVIEVGLKNNLLDYIAMDVKNSLAKYPQTCSTPHIEINRILESIQLIKSASIDYEFRTTVIQEFHNYNDMLAIGELIKGAHQYYLQSYEKSPHQLTETLYHAYPEETLLEYKEALRPYVENIGIRGL
jgi:pyruvate formate lyase activating enzyme